eukprot:3494377-Amphidinium_carterae.1
MQSVPVVQTANKQLVRAATCYPYLSDREAKPRRKQCLKETIKETYQQDQRQHSPMRRRAEITGYLGQLEETDNYSRA